jgi:hypothetical protein
VPLGYAHSHGDTDANPDPNANNYTQSDSNADSNPYSHRDTYTNTNSYADTDANRHADPDCDSHSYTYRHAGPDHTQRAWLQSAGFADGGSLMGRGDFKQH